jgi:GT2 family glycosyltransferase
MKNFIDCTIIIVSFNTKELLHSCLLSIRNSDLKNYHTEIIIYDNASGDGSQEMIIQNFPEITLIKGDENIGFAAGNNRAIAKAKGKYILLLNSDTELFPDTLQKMLDFMEEKKAVGAATAMLILSDNTMDPACHRGFPTPWAALTYITKLEKLFPASHLFGQYHQGYKGFSTIHEIDCPSGAFFLVPREIITKVGLLDEDYFMYAEDIDWAYRIKQHKYKIYFNPEAVCKHLKKQSGRAQDNSELKLKTDKYFYQTMELFYRKHLFSHYPKIITLLIISVIRFKLFLLSKQNI